MDLESSWPQGYHLVQGSSLDRARLVAAMGNAYAELGATQLGHLAKTVELYLASPSTLWWLEKLGSPARVGFTATQPDTLGCLWLGPSINQLTGELQAYIYLVEHAKQWASAQGYKQLSLQVSIQNTAAIELYNSLGYESKAIWMTSDM